MDHSEARLTLSTWEGLQPFSCKGRRPGKETQTDLFVTAGLVKSGLKLHKRIMLKRGVGDLQTAVSPTVPQHGNDRTGVVCINISTQGVVLEVPSQSRGLIAPAGLLHTTAHQKKGRSNQSSTVPIQWTTTTAHPARLCTPYQQPAVRIA